MARRPTALLLLACASILLVLQTGAVSDFDDDFEEQDAPARRTGGGVQGRGQNFDGVLEGRILIPEQLKATHHISAPYFGVYLYTSQGTVLRAFCTAEGIFTFHDVPTGSHLLHVDLMGVGFPEVRLDVTGREGLVRASIADSKVQQLIGVTPLLIRPVGLFSYLETRKPLDLKSLIMSPYGLMIGFSLFAIFVFPRMKVDPEEYKELQQSISGVTGGAAPARVGGASTATQPRVRNE